MLGEEAKREAAREATPASMRFYNLYLNREFGSACPRFTGQGGVSPPWKSVCPRASQPVGAQKSVDDRERKSGADPCYGAEHHASVSAENQRRAGASR